MTSETRRPALPEKDRIVRRLYAQALRDVAEMIDPGREQIPLSDLRNVHGQGLSVRARNALGRFGCRTAEDVAARVTAYRLLAERNCGKTTVMEIRTMLEHNGYTFENGALPR